MAPKFTLCGMARPGERLGELLKKRDITPTQFGEMLREEFKLKADYNFVKKWIDGRGFDSNPRNQSIAEGLLGLEPGYFSNADAPKNKQDPVRYASLRAYLSRREELGEPVVGGARTYLVRAQALVTRDPGETWWLNQHLLYLDMERNAGGGSPKTV